MPTSTDIGAGGDQTAEGSRYVHDAMGGTADGEPVRHVQWCRPNGSSERGHGGIGRRLARLFGGGDGLTGMMVLAVTDTRLILLAAKQGWGGMTVGDVLAQWPLGEATISSRGRTATTTYHRTELNRKTVRTKLTVVTLPDGREIELPRGESTSALVQAVAAPE